MNYVKLRNFVTLILYYKYHKRLQGGEPGKHPPKTLKICKG